jgi:hypothetical protein
VSSYSSNSLQAVSCCVATIVRPAAFRGQVAQQSHRERCGPSMALLPQGTSMVLGIAVDTSIRPKLVRMFGAAAAVALLGLGCE